jgi:DNA-binding beta-propeller fold protein YncE
LFVLLVGLFLGMMVSKLITSDKNLFSAFEQNGENLSFQSTDKNHDGKITKREFRKFLLADAKNKTKYLQGNESEKLLVSGTTGQFNQADTNKDGVVSPVELSVYFKAVAAKSTATSDCPLNGECGDACCHSEYTWTNIQPEYSFKGPMQMTATQNGKMIFVVHQDADEIAVLDTSKKEIVRTYAVGNQPQGITLSGDEKTLYVTSGSDQGKIQIIDTESGNIVNEISAGHTPMSPVLSKDGKKLFVCNRFSNNIGEYDLTNLTFVRNIKVIREPRGAVISSNGTKLFVINFLPNDPNNFPEQPDKKIDVAAEVTVIEIASGNTQNIRLPNGSCMIQGVCLSPDGRYLYLTHILSRYMNDTDKLDNGQMNVNAVSLIDTTQLDKERGGYVNTVLLDDPKVGAANPWGIAVSADGKQLFVAIAGTNEMIIVNAEEMHKKLAADNADVSGDLTFLANLKKRIKLQGKGAREIIAVDSDVYVGMYFNDTIEKINVADNDITESDVSEIAIGSKAVLSQKRAGEMYWNDATLCYQQWQSCASCHPDGCMTGMNWDLLHDGRGNPKNTKSLLLSHDTPPTMWLGDRKHAQQCTRTGFRFIMFTMPQRDPCFTIDEYTRTMKPLKSPYLINGELSEKAKRGKKVFEDNTIGCTQCHSGQYFTDMKMHNVNSGDQYSETVHFDTPTLIEVWRTAPYLHDGRYVEMKDVFKHGKHGIANPLSDSEIDDLVEYVLSL